MLDNIKGNFEEINNDSRGPYTVLYLPCNRSQFEMARIISQQSKHNSYIFIENMEKYIDYLSPDINKSKAKFFNDFKTLASFFKGIDKIVVFVGSVQTFLPVSFNKILSAALELKKPIYEMPHGLFQSGYNLTDLSQIIDNASFYKGFGGHFPSVSARKIRWYGSEGVGYPRTTLRATYDDRVLPEFNLITSNTNWYLYNHLDKRLFFKLVFDYASSHPEELFIWSPHPAEMADNTYSSMIGKFRPKNILLYGIKNDIYFNKIESTDDLIPYCKMGITTVSTCLLDYEIHQKKPSYFIMKGLNRLLKK